MTKLPVYMVFEDKFC